jgi:hypothetical protein
MYEARSLLEDVDTVAYVVLEDAATVRQQLAVAHGALQWVRWHVSGATRQHVDAALRVVGDMGED